MNDCDILRKAVIQSPWDDTVRLVYCDALEERNAPGDAGRARFVRDQIALHSLGKPRETFTCAVVGRGPGYWEVPGVTLYPGQLKAGDRIDVNEFSTGTRGGKFRKFHGLLVTKILPDSSAMDTVRLALKQDEYSVPYPDKEYERLTKSTHALLYAHWLDWGREGALDRVSFQFGPKFTAPRTPDRMYVLSTVGDDDAWSTWAEWRYERGFVSVVSGTPGQWYAYADMLTELEPICRVEFTDTPELFHGIGELSADHVFSLEGVSNSPVRRLGLGSTVSEREITLSLLRERWPSVPADGWVLPPDDDE